MIAAIGLKGLEALALKHGVALNVGEVKRVEEYLSTAEGEGEGPQPIDVASRVIAHIGHRVPGIRKLEKRLEGKDAKSGILADLMALVGNLAVRNEGAIFEAAGFGGGTDEEVIDITPIHMDFGTVDPVDK